MPTFVLDAVEHIANAIEVRVRVRVRVRIWVKVRLRLRVAVNVSVNVRDTVRVKFRSTSAPAARPPLFHLCFTRLTRPRRPPDACRSRRGSLPCVVRLWGN